MYFFVYCTRELSSAFLFYYSLTCVYICRILACYRPYLSLMMLNSDAALLYVFCRPYLSLMMLNSDAALLYVFCECVANNVRTCTVGQAFITQNSQFVLSVHVSIHTSWCPCMCPSTQVGVQG
jgi:hypothetical protein